MRAYYYDKATNLETALNQQTNEINYLHTPRIFNSA